jgi:hypothetical protein
MRKNGQRRAPPVPLPVVPVDHQVVPVHDQVYRRSPSFGTRPSSRRCPMQGLPQRADDRLAIPMK